MNGIGGPKFPPDFIKSFGVANFDFDGDLFKEAKKIGDRVHEAFLNMGNPFTKFFPPPQSGSIEIEVQEIPFEKHHHHEHNRMRRVPGSSMTIEEVIDDIDDGDIMWWLDSKPLNSDDNTNAS